MAIVFGSFSLSQAAEVVMKPGVLHGFEVQVPPRARAGEPFMVRILARDEFGNLKTDYRETCKGTLIGLMDGEGSIVPSRVSAVDFLDGVAQVSVELDRAGRASIRVQERDGLQEGVSVPFEIFPGTPARLLVSAPQETVAAEGFQVQIVAVDAYRNLCSDFFPKGGVVFKNNRGHGFHPQSMDGKAFERGKASVLLSCDKAGDFTLTVESRDPDCRGISDLIRVYPGPVSAFALGIPAQVTAGESVPLRIMAKDAWDNTVWDYARLGGGVSLRLENGQPIQPEFLAATEFFSGEIQTEVVFQRSGPTRILVCDDKTNTETLGDLIHVASGRLHHFDVESPITCQVKDPFHLRIVARDVFGNRVEAYDRIGNGVHLTNSGSSDLEPSFVPADRFVRGLAEVETTYPVAESICLTVSESGGLAVGSSRELLFLPGEAERFVVTVIPSAGGFRAGIPFAVCVEARDRYNNLVENFAQSGVVVELLSSGTGKISPNRFSASAFDKGMLNAQCVYNKAEAFQLTARRMTDAKDVHIEIPEQKGGPGTLGQVEALIESHRYQEAAAMLRDILERDPLDKRAQQTLDRLKDVIEILQ